MKGDPNSNQEIVPKYARLSRQRKASHFNITSALPILVLRVDFGINSLKIKSTLMDPMICRLLTQAQMPPVSAKVLGTLIQYSTFHDNNWFPVYNEG